jgi:phosphatidylserine decarboxylase
VIESRINNKLPVAREGLPFILIPFCFGMGLFLAYWFWAIGPALWIGLPVLIFSLFSAWFFRDPERESPTDENAILSPADGVIVLVSEVDDVRFLKTKALKISVFMSVFNVHVNRAPISGLIERVEYYPGKFLSANLDKASIENEHNALILRKEDGTRIAFVQIAGLIARRIVCWAQSGDKVVKGQRFGLIRFGSRLDIYLPLLSDVSVKPGQKVRAGQTILGYLP